MFRLPPAVVFYVALWGSAFGAGETQSFAALRAELEAIQADHPGGRVSVYARELGGAEAFEFNSSRAVNQVGAMRLHIISEIYRRAAAGKLDLKKVVPVSSVSVKSGAGVLRLLPSATLNLQDYATAMIVQNDAVATAVLLNEVGLDAVNASVREFGLTETSFTLERATTEVGADTERWRRVSSARDIAHTVEKIATGKVLDEASTREVMSALSHPKPSFIRPAFPRDATVATLATMNNTTRSEVAFVTLGERRIVICIIGQRSRERAQEVDGNEIVNQVARKVAAHFVSPQTASTSSSSSDANMPKSDSLPSSSSSSK